MNYMKRNRFTDLEGVTGLGQIIRIRDKYSRDPFTVGHITGEVSVCDGEQKFFIQQIQLAEGIVVAGDPTRWVLRSGYYTRRRDGLFCLGSQFSPILTPAEYCNLSEQVRQKAWLK